MSDQAQRVHLDVTNSDADPFFSLRETAMENAANLEFSVLPTSPKFDPRLFLTLVHRQADYNVMIESISRLSSKTENQVEQLQNLVRENFPLFVRCAEGYDEFRQTSQTIVGMGVSERLEKLDAIAEAATFQAKKSFKPVSSSPLYCLRTVCYSKLIHASAAVG